MRFEDLKKDMVLIDDDQWVIKVTTINEMNFRAILLHKPIYNSTAAKVGEEVYFRYNDIQKYGIRICAGYNTPLYKVMHKQGENND